MDNFLGVHFQVSLELRLTFVVKDDLPGWAEPTFCVSWLRFTMTIVRCHELSSKSDQDFRLPVWNVLLNLTCRSTCIHLGWQLGQGLPNPSWEDVTWSWGRGEKLSRGAIWDDEGRGHSRSEAQRTGKQESFREEKNKSRELLLWLEKLRKA